jgi:hypothetical protein
VCVSARRRVRVGGGGGGAGFAGSAQVQRRFELEPLVSFAMRAQMSEASAEDIYRAFVQEKVDAAPPPTHTSSRQVAPSGDQVSASLCGGVN